VLRTAVVTLFGDPRGEAETLGYPFDVCLLATRDEKSGGKQLLIPDFNNDKLRVFDFRTRTYTFVCPKSNGFVNSLPVVHCAQ